MPRACGAWPLGAVRTPGVPLEDDGTAAALARPVDPGADYRPSARRPAGADALQPRNPLSAGAVRLFRQLSRMAPVGHDCRDPGLMDPWLHRLAYVAADEAVLQARRAVAVRRGHPAACARHARRLSRRPDRRR